jgi:hypothetical protein
MKKLLILIAVIGGSLAFNSCKKKYDAAPIADETKGHVYSVAELKAIANCTNTCTHRFSNDAYLIGVVIADELSGNFYKEIYLRDRYNTGGIHLAMKASNGDFFVGDSVHLNLKNYDVNINSRTGMLEIDTIDFEKHMVKFASGANPQPIVVDLSSSNYANYLCDLIVINGAGFLPADANQIWADPISQTSINRTIKDCAGTQLVVRTSNYALFAQQKTPAGFGSIIGIAQAYSGTNQMAIRRPSEVNMNGTPCILYNKKDFEDNSLTSGGWAQVSVTNPSVTWAPSLFSGNYSAKITGYYSSANHNSENWLISPSLNLSAGVNPILTFLTMAKFSGNNLEVLVSTNYTSGLPGTATWINLSGFTLSPNTGNYVPTGSGIISLSSFKTANTRIAFKYTSTTSAGTTYEVDDIVIREN